MDSKGAWIIGGAIVVAGAFIGAGIYLANDATEEAEKVVYGRIFADYRAQLRSTLGNAAAAQERHLTSSTSYTDSVSDLEEQGFSPSPGVTLEIVEATDTGFCHEASRFPDFHETW